MTSITAHSGGGSGLHLRNLDHRQEQAQLADRVGESLIVHRLGDVDVAAQIVTALDLDLVIGGGEHHDWRAPQLLSLIHI